LFLLDGNHFWHEDSDHCDKPIGLVTHAL